MSDALSPEEAEAYFARLERELARGAAHLAARLHAHREGTRIHCVLGVTEGGGRYRSVETRASEGREAFEDCLREFGEKIWSALLPEGR